MNGGQQGGREEVLGKRRLIIIPSDTMKAATTAATDGSRLSAKVGHARWTHWHWHWFLAFVVLTVLTHSSANLLSKLFESQPSPPLVEDDLCIEQPQKHDTKISMHIPGNGFSGFFFTLGRLEAFLNQNHRTDASEQAAARSRNENGTEALPPTPDVEYHCWSAGCLSLIAALLEVPIQATLDLALTARESYARGDIGRYDIVENFVDGLLSYESHCENGEAEIDSDFNTSCSCTEQSGFNKLENTTLSTINVVSSAWSFDGANPLLEKVTRSPSNVGELRAMLLDTTRIPFLTGNTFGEKDTTTGAYHNDGAIAVWYHKTTSRSSSGGRSLGSSSDFCSDDASFKLSLPPWSVSMYANMLNMNFGKDLATGFWRDGMDMGVELPKAMG